MENTALVKVCFPEPHPLLRGFEMAPCYLLVVAWICFLFLHLRRPQQRPSLSKLLIGTSLLIAIFAPMKFIYEIFQVSEMTLVTGQHQPILEHQILRLHAQCALYTGALAAVLLTISIAAWLLPEGKRQNQGA